MSSYQFVNTLAQCYAEQTAAQQATQVSQDYYNMNYPNCYSPNLTNHSQYGQYSLMMSGQAAAAMAAGMADYGVAGGGGIPGGGGSVISNNLSSSSQQGHRRSANPSPSTVINQISNNCNKYSDSSVGGSPQDLRTSSAGGTPQPMMGHPKTCSSPLSQSPLSPMTSPAGVAAVAAAAVAAAGKTSVKNICQSL